jgi:hypothetical protein
MKSPRVWSMFGIKHLDKPIAPTPPVCAMFAAKHPNIATILCARLDLRSNLGDRVCAMFVAKHLDFTATLCD